MIPAAFVTLAALPLTPNGKVDRNALPDPENALTRGRQVPQSEAERIVLDAWREVLGRRDIAVDENFFEAGGHSLLLVRLQTKLCAVFGEFPLVDLFRLPTIETMAQHLAMTSDATNRGLQAARDRAERQRSAKTRARSMRQYHGGE